MEKNILPILGLSAAYPILFIFVTNLPQVHFSEIIPALIVVEACVVLLFLLFNAFIRNGQKSALIIAAFIFWLFSYGFYYNLFIGFTLNNIVLGRERWIIPFWMVILLAIWLHLLFLKNEQRLKKYTQGLKLFFILLFIFCIITGGFYISKQLAGDTFMNSKSEADNPTNNHPQKGLPNVFYIILDAYSADTTLKDVYGYDNTCFTRFLRKKGFFVADRSCSNYPMTGLSLPSSLSMVFLREKNAYPLDKSEVLTEFKHLGYKINIVGSWWLPTAENRKRLGLIKGTLLTELNIKLLEISVLKPLAPQLMAPLYREGILSALDAVVDLSKEQKPQFVFAHILCPHPPFVFGSHGENMNPFGSTIDCLTNPFALYVNQVKYLNILVESVIEEILKSSKRPPIIVIQGDHGSAFIFRPMHNRANPDDFFLKTQFRILNAYYLPSGGKKFLYRSISPVNTFRIIFNYYFGKHYSLLPDRSYYSTYQALFPVIDVTKKVKY